MKADGFTKTKQGEDFVEFRMDIGVNDDSDHEHAPSISIVISLETGPVYSTLLYDMLYKITLIIST